jgi:copper(I)-binding protein
MSFNSFVRAAAAAFVLSAPALAPAFAGDMAPIMVEDAYARSSTAMSTSGAAFMMLVNHGQEDDRLVSATSDVAERVELHTHIQDAAGVMKMVEVKEGFVVPAGGMHALQRGGDHVMFMGIKQPFEQGKIINVTLTFEKAGDIAVEIPVDLERKPMHGMQHQMPSN